MKNYIDWFMGGVGACVMVALPNVLALAKAIGIW